MQVKIVGVKKSSYKGKDGKDKVGFNYLGTKQFTSYEMENNECEGEDVVREFSNTDFKLHPGDVVDFEYEPGFEQRATLVGVRPISLNGNPFDGDGKKTSK